MNQLEFRPIKHIKMTVWTSVLWKITIQLAKKWPEMVVKKPFTSVIHFYSDYIWKFQAFMNSKKNSCRGNCMRKYGSWTITWWNLTFNFWILNKLVLHYCCSLFLARNLVRFLGLYGHMYVLGARFLRMHCCDSEMGYYYKQH